MRRQRALLGGHSGGGKLDALWKRQHVDYGKQKVTSGLDLGEKRHTFCVLDTRGRRSGELLSTTKGGGFRTIAIRVPGAPAETSKPIARFHLVVIYGSKHGPIHRVRICAKSSGAGSRLQRLAPVGKRQINKQLAISVQ